jgi:hypothetical protein
MSVTGMVLGIVGFVFSFIPCVGWVLGVILGILGCIFSAVGIAQASKTGEGKGMGVTGLVLSILAIIWAPLLWIVFWGSLVGSVNSAIKEIEKNQPRSQPPSKAPFPPGPPTKGPGGPR